MNAQSWAVARWWAIVTVLAVAIALGIRYVGDFSSELDDARADRDALATQVRQLGGTPVAGTPGKDGAQGLPGRDGANGVDGSPGPSGAPGATGKTGATGAPGAAGKTGAVGTDGKDGAQGTPGDVGPTGPPGPTGPAGPQGETGPKGDTGDVVQCPDGYTATEIIIVPHPGTYMVCKKDYTE